LTAIESAIRPGATESSLAAACRDYMDERGATDYWWHGVPALVLSGARLRLSVEGDVYRPSDAPLGTDDMVTIDLSPEVNGYWGDAARSYFLKDGVLVSAKEAGAEQAEGVAVEAALHQRLLEVAYPEMTFRQLHAEIDAKLRELGFENLDFLNNYGHSIERDIDSRIFTDPRCTRRLDSVALFTFEPHIARPGSRYAFKYEEIYRFEAGRLRAL
jgi:Xaa-Pro aminopeptidase